MGSISLLPSGSLSSGVPTVGFSLSCVEKGLLLLLPLFWVKCFLYLKLKNQLQEFPFASKNVFWGNMLSKCFGSSFNTVSLSFSCSRSLALCLSLWLFSECLSIHTASISPICSWFSNGYFCKLQFRSCTISWWTFPPGFPVGSSNWTYHQNIKLRAKLIIIPPKPFLDSTISLHVTIIPRLPGSELRTCFYCFCSLPLQRVRRCCGPGFLPHLAATNSCLGDPLNLLGFSSLQCTLHFVTDLIKILPWLRGEKRAYPLLQNTGAAAQVSLWWCAFLAFS